MRLPLVALALCLLAAGCVAVPDAAPAAAPPGATPETLAAVRALLDGVPCEAEVGAGTSANIVELTRFSLDAEVTEMDVRGHRALLARTSPPGLLVVDVADPLAPRVLSALDLDHYPLDVKWTASGDGAWVGSLRWLGLVDLRDVAAPTLAAEVELPAQGHSMSQTLVEGVEWVYVAGQTHLHGTFVLRRDGWGMSLVGHYLTHGLLSTPLGHHDAAVLLDPLEERPLLYVAQGFEGWTVADISDPANPRKIGGTPAPELGPGYTHMLRVHLVDGKRIVMSMQEVGVNTLNIYDATDLALPKLLARWTADAARPHIPQHNLQVAGDYLYMAHYGQGVFVFNLTDIVARAGVAPLLDVEPVAHYAVEEPDEPSPLGFADIVDIALDSGVLLATDQEDGLITIGFGCVTPGDATQDARL